MNDFTRFILAVLSAALFTIAAPAENTRLMLLFGGSPGEAVPHAYDYGVPDDAGDTYTMRIPLVKPEISAVFYDTLVTVSATEKIVTRVEAERAYRSLRECNDGLAVVEEKLGAALLKPYDGTAGTWQYLAADGKAAAEVTCTKRPRRPFFVLRLVLLQPE